MNMTVKKELVIKISIIQYMKLYFVIKKSYISEEEKQVSEEIISKTKLKKSSKKYTNLYWKLVNIT